MRKLGLCLLVSLGGLTVPLHAQKFNQRLTVVAYYDGNSQSIDAYPVEKLTHILFSFCHLKGNKLWVQNKQDSLTIEHLVSLKKRNPSLKILLSMGGWGGCGPCSLVFSTEKGRREFAESVLGLSRYFKTDGIDLDWEYPVIEGFPGHRYAPEDKADFTSLIQDLRKALGSRYEISFAAGGFTTYLEQSIDWKKVIPLVDRVNLMTYDLVNGYTKVSGHHTPLYSTPGQIESADHAVHILDSLGVPLNKLTIGAAFYARAYEIFHPTGDGLYERGKYSFGISYKNLRIDSLKKAGFEYRWDKIAEAPFLYSAPKKLLISFDDQRSVTLKMQYVIQKGLNGIMFWQLGDDLTRKGLLDAIYMAKTGENK